MNLAGRIALAVLLIAVLLPAIAAACPLCKDAKADTDYPGGSASLPKGFYYSILLMVAAPFAVVGGLVFRIWLARRHAPAVVAGESALSPESPRPRFVPDSRGAQP